MNIGFSKNNFPKIAEFILSGKICVLPTDTLYGISCSALIPEAVEQIYALKQRELNKPYIVLIADISDLAKFDVSTTPQVTSILRKNWPAPLSVVFDVKSEKLAYLHRATCSIAFRIPRYPLLLELLQKTGPLTSTTINRSGEAPAKNITEAQGLFGHQIDLYVDTGSSLDATPSTVIKFVDNTVEVVRQGSYNLKL